MYYRISDSSRNDIKTGSLRTSSTSYGARRVKFAAQRCTAASVSFLRLSQCREFTVVSKVSDSVNAIMFDLNLIETENKWNLCVLDKEEIPAVQNVDKLLKYPSGTLVVWKKFDKIESRAKK